MGESQKGATTHAHFVSPAALTLVIRGPKLSFLTVMANLREREIPSPPPPYYLSAFFRLVQTIWFFRLVQFWRPDIRIRISQLSLSAFVRFSLHIKSSSFHWTFGTPFPPEAYFCSAYMTNARWIFSFSVTALLLFSHFLPSSARESALNPLSRVPGQQERQLTGSSFYNRKLGVYIKKRWRFRAHAGGRNLQPFEICSLPSMLALLFASPFSSVSSRCSLCVTAYVRTKCWAACLHAF